MNTYRIDPDYDGPTLSEIAPYSETISGVIECRWDGATVTDLAADEALQNARRDVGFVCKDTSAGVHAAECLGLQYRVDDKDLNTARSAWASHRGTESLVRLHGARNASAMLIAAHPKMEATIAARLLDGMLPSDVWLIASLMRSGGTT